MFSIARPMNFMSARDECSGPGRQDKLGSMRGAVPFLERPVRATGLSLVGPEPERSTRLAGISAAWRNLLAEAEMSVPHVRVAAIEGEPGSGKQTLASYMLRCSRFAGSAFQRRDAREWLATDGDPAAVNGFLYLDRVDLLTSPGQNLLLRVVRVLESYAPGRAVLLVSSQASLRRMAGQGHFLPDLAFRLTAVRFAVPALRERREDIAPLAQVLLDRLCVRYQQRPVALGPGSLARLLQHDWPGNIRELAGVLELALMEAVNGVILPENLALNGVAEPQIHAKPPVAADNLSLDAVIRRHVQYVLGLNHGNKLRAARQLHISRSTLYRILGNESLLAH